MDDLLLIADLRRDEGERLTSYRDSLGLWTIGVGHLIDPVRGGEPAPFGVDLRHGGTITAAQSEALLLRDIENKRETLDKRIPWWRSLSEARQQVLLQMAFNLGVAGLLGFKHTLQAIQGGRFVDAAEGMRASLWYRQVGSRGKRLVDMMVQG